MKGYLRSDEVLRALGRGVAGNHIVEGALGGKLNAALDHCKELGLL